MTLSSSSMAQASLCVDINHTRDIYLLSISPPGVVLQPEVLRAVPRVGEELRGVLAAGVLPAQQHHPRPRHPAGVLGPRVQQTVALGPGAWGEVCLKLLMAVVGQKVCILVGCWVPPCCHLVLV